MRNLSISSGMVTLVLAVIVSACGGGAMVAIKTLDPTSQEGCYTSGVGAELVTDPTAGTAILGGRHGPRTAVTWPRGWTARTSGSEVEVLDRKGQVAYRTGTYVDLPGGFSNVDGSFVVCGLELIP